MRKIFFVLLVFSTFVATCQNYKNPINQFNSTKADSDLIYIGQKKYNDGDLKVSYPVLNNDEKPAIFINGIFLGSSFFFDTKEIEKVDVKKEKIEVGGVVYFGQINITTTANYQPNFSTIVEIEKEYLGTSTARCLIMIDSKIIQDNRSSVFIDRNYILKILVEKVDATSRSQTVEPEKIDFIHILTKTEENVKKSEEIRIR
jgi:hypothetical protein